MRLFKKDEDEAEEPESGPRDVRRRGPPGRGGRLPGEIVAVQERGSGLQAVWKKGGKEDKETDIEEEDEEEKKEPEWKVVLFRDIPIAVLIMVIIIGSIWAYTGNWPPVVVVQSGSMMHDSDSSIGVIDTGDLVLVKKVESKSDITTYYEGRDNNYKMYGEYGDVIVYRKNGLDESKATPVIHRVLFWLEFDEARSKADPQYPSDGHYWFNIPELNKKNLTGDVEIDNNFPAYAPGESDGKLTIHLDRIYGLMRHDPHSGYITKGDNNPIDNIDQYSTSTPVKMSWIIGKARGEMPWFGLIKLYVSKSLDGSPPPTSVNMLILTISLIIVIPIILDLAYGFHVKRKRARKDEEERLRESTHGEGRRDFGPPQRGRRGR